MNGADAVLACLRAEGIKYIFGNPGTTEIPLLDALSAAPDITYVLALQEGVAVGMADGYARSGGKIGFVSVHTAAGTSNCLGGMYNAFIERTPLMVVAGCKDTRLLGRGCFSEVTDFPGMARQFTKLSWQVLRSDRIAEDLLRGIRTALTPPHGPVFMPLCEDLLRQEVKLGTITSHLPKTAPSCSGDTEALQQAARLLASARSPLLIAGSEIAWGDALPDAVALAELLGMPVVTEGREALCTLNFPHSHPSFRGGFEPALPCVKGADVILGIGCSMFVQTNYSPEPEVPQGAKIIHFHSDPHEFARMYPEEVSVITDAKKGIADLMAALKPLMTDGLKKTVRERRKKLQADKDALDKERNDEIAAVWDKKPIALLRLVRELKQAVAPDAIIVDEAIRSSRALLKHFIFDHPGSYHRSCAGVLGWGLPASLGVKLANPGRQVVAFVGDGGFTFSVQSLWSAARYNIPVVVVICNNRQYRAVKDAFARYKGVAAQTGNYVGTDIASPGIDFCRVAEGFGVWAKRAVNPEEVKPLLAEALTLGKPAVVEVMLTEM